jgi:hypothetical protein
MPQSQLSDSYFGKIS